MSWATFLTSGLKEDPQCVMQHSLLPPKSAQVVASTLGTFLTQGLTSQATILSGLQVCPKTEGKIKEVEGPE